MTTITSDSEKKLAAYEALKYVTNGMILGLGTGSTAEHMIRGLGVKVSEGLQIKGVPSSERSARLARELGIPLTTLEVCVTLDLTIDGADEFDQELRLIKGGGGALLREKILAHNSKMNIIITDSSKAVERLGAFKLPVEVIPLAVQPILQELNAMELEPVLRKTDQTVYRTDENNFILDLNIVKQNDLTALNYTLLSIPGVVETGLFLDTTDILIMGKGEGTATVRRA